MAHTYADSKKQSKICALCAKHAHSVQSIPRASLQTTSRKLARVKLLNFPHFKFGYVFCL